MGVADVLKLAVELSSKIASRYGCRIVASALYGSRVAGYAKPSSDVDVLLILENYGKGILYLYEEYCGYLFAVLTVDKALFELDLEKGELGEFVVGRLLTPFIPIEGAEYLKEASVKFKMRVILETLTSLKFEYPEAYTDLRIKPEFFLYEKLWKRASIYPPVKYSYSRILSDELKSKNLPVMMEGFMEALKKLEAEGIVRFENGYVVPVKSPDVKASERVLSIFKEVERATRAYITHGYAGRSMSPMKVAWEFASKVFRGSSLKGRGTLEQPELYIYLPSSAGYVSVLESFSPEALTEKIQRFKGFKVESIEKLGGTLNFVDLITLRKNGELNRVVLKRFKDWYGFKWFPLSIWTLGVQKFALKGKTRMLKEYSAFIRLSKWNLPSPKIIYISLADKLLLTEYIPGQTFDEVLSQLFSKDDVESSTLEVCRSVGKAMAKVHNRGMVLGDPKPENIKLFDSKVYFLDLEQSSMGGDQAWDLAELLYFTGHMTLSSKKAELYASSILDGYLEVGRGEIIRKITDAKYIRVFTMVAPPNVLLAISRVCKNYSTRKL